jgi:hypothetical protein
LLAVTLASTQTSGILSVGDFDGDGRPDLAFAGYDDRQMGGFVTGGGGVALPAFVPKDFALNVYRNAGQGNLAAPASYAKQGDGTVAAPTIYHLHGTSEPLTDAIVAGDFNGDGVCDIAVATTGRFSPYPAAVHVLLSRCE